VKTTFDSVDIIWNALVNAGVKSLVSGGVYKSIRPINSTKEDFVVNSLPLFMGQLQNTVVNVNIHVPNLTIVANGAQDGSQPDLERLKVLTNLAVGILDNKWGNGYNYSVQQQNVIQDYGNYFSNIRIQFVWVNLN
jgi:hypothetical protein